MGSRERTVGKDLRIGSREHLYHDCKRPALSVNGADEKVKGHFAIPTSHLHSLQEEK